MNTLGPAGKSIVVLVVLALGAAVWYVSGSPLPPAGPVACTMEAKLCPDGSAVGRTGPNCEFAACPAATTTPPAGGGGSVLPYATGIQGTVMAGPTCPVERNPPDPQCADRPLQTLVAIYRASDPVHAVVLTRSDAAGKFSASLPPGEYIVGAGEGMLPRCNSTPATVESSGYTTIAVSCDTGIR